MMPSDFVYNQVLQGCRDAGLSEHAATLQANQALTLYKQHQYQGKPTGLIKDQIALAKKINQKESKK